MSPPTHFIAAIGQPAFLCSSDGTITEANDCLETLAGRCLVGYSSADLVGIFDYRRPDGTPLDQADLPSSRALRGEKVFNSPIQITVKDNKDRCILATAWPVYEESGGVGALSIWQDVSVIETASHEGLGNSADCSEKEIALPETVERRAIALPSGGNTTGFALDEIDKDYLKALTELIPIPIRISFSSDCHTITGNAASNKAYEAGPDENVSANTSSSRKFFLNGLPADPAELPLQRATAEEKTVEDVEMEVELLSGRHIFMLGSATPLRNRDGSVGGSIGAFIDITDRKRQEKELQLALDAVKMGLWRYDLNSKSASVDERSREIFQVTRESLSLDDIIDQIHQDDRSDVRGKLQESFNPVNSKPDSTEFRIPFGKDDNWIEMHWIPFCEGTDAKRWVTGLVGTVRDITKKKVRDTRARRFQGLLQSVGVMILALGPDGQVNLINKRGCEILDLPLEQIVNKNWVDHFVPEGSREELRDALQRAFAGEVESFKRHENPILTRDGQVRNILWSNRPITDENEVIIEILSSGEDITEQKELEMALQRSNEELNQFAYVVSHDLQEPLRSIISFSGLLDRKYRGQLDAEADEFLQFIVEAGKRMQDLIRDLLQFSRVETQGVNPVSTDTGQVVAAVRRSMVAACDRVGATITVGEMPMVLADPSQLDQILTNLIGNAIKYCRPGVPPMITVSAELQDGWWEIAVRDNGLGIAPEHFDRIFEKFYRLHTHDEYEGTGIGLAIVKRIVERHGGTIRVESTPGEGSTFFFTLPAA